jgi:hypothetical protein
MSMQLAAKEMPLSGAEATVTELYLHFQVGAGQLTPSGDVTT